MANDRRFAPPWRADKNPPAAMSSVTPTDKALVYIYARIAGWAARRLNEPIELMTLGNMRENSVRSLDVSCYQCDHRAIMRADRWPRRARAWTGVQW
jgi:hypothetical protein